MKNNINRISRSFPPPPPPPPTSQGGNVKKSRTGLIMGVVVGVMIAVILVGLIFSGIIPLAPRPSPSPTSPSYSTFTPSPTSTPFSTATPFPTSSPSLSFPETAHITGLLASDNTLIANGATTDEKVLTLKGNVTNPAPVSGSPSTLTTSSSEGGKLTLTTGIHPVQSVENRVFHGHVVLVLSESQRYLAVSPLPQDGGADLWEFEGAVVLANGANTFSINVLNDNNQTVGQSRSFTVASTVPLTDLRVTLAWDTNSSDLDLHIWHFPYIESGSKGGMDGAGGWWQWYGKWEGLSEVSSWIPESNPSDDYLNIESFTWRTYSYTYNQQQYNYGDGVSHAWYDNKTSITSGSIDVDARYGFGPEIFTMANLRPGLYTAVVRFYTPHDCNTTTTATVTIQLPDGPKTFSHQFEPISNGDDVVQYPSTFETHRSDFPQGTVTDWVAYSFYVLPDKTVVTPVEKELSFGADCKVSSTGGYFRDRWFLLDHATPISTIISGWVTGTEGTFSLERLGDSGVELIIRIAIGGVGYQPGGVWQGVTQNIPPGLYRLSAGNAVEGPNSINIAAKVMSAP